MLKVLIVCANGTGTSLMMKEKAQMSLIKLGIETAIITIYYIQIELYL